MTANVPLRFQGTPEEARAKYLTHDWSSFGDERECFRCFCKPWHVAASYPCGTEPPRVEVDADEAVAEQNARFGLYAAAVSATD
jgi:hypothetical protein